MPSRAGLWKCGSEALPLSLMEIKAAASRCRTPKRPAGLIDKLRLSLSCLSFLSLRAGGAKAGRALRFVLPSPLLLGRTPPDLSLLRRCRRRIEELVIRAAEDAHAVVATGVRLCISLEL